MNKNIYKISNRTVIKRDRGGSALILTVVLTVLLALVGVFFVMASRVDKMSTSNIARTHDLDIAVKTVIKKINKTLVEDLYGQDLYDYPDPDNYWLAPIEPEYVEENINGTDKLFYVWNHITDLWNNNFALDDYSAAYYDPDNLAENHQYDLTDSDSYPWLVYNDYDSDGKLKYTLAKIVDENSPMNVVKDRNDTADDPDEIPWGARADADGDGIADSRWVPVPNLLASDGSLIYTAVRIIDNSGMLNINTAFRNPENLPTPADWDGSHLGHVSMETSLTDPEFFGLQSFTDTNAGFDIWDLHSKRMADMAPPATDLYMLDTFYEQNVARYLPQNALTATPFEISDELELRNRYFLNTPVVPSCATAWPSTFEPGNSTVGKTIPYNLDSDSDLDNWFDKTKPDIEQPDFVNDPADWKSKIGNYNRRLISTTYSAQKQLAPNGSPKIALGTNIDTVTGLKQIDSIDISSVKNTVSDAFANDDEDDDVKTWLGSNYTKDKAAAQFAVNLADYIDTDNSISSFTESDPNGTAFYFGLESLDVIDDITIFASEAVYFYNDDVSIAPVGHYYTIELYNPDTSPKSLNAGSWHYEIYINSTASDFTYDLRNLFTPGENIGPNGTVILSNNTPTDTAAVFTLDASKIRQAPNLEFSEGVEITVLRINNSTGLAMPVDNTKIPSGMFPIPGQIYASQRNRTFGNKNLLLTKSWSAVSETHSLGSANTTSPVTDIFVDPEKKANLTSIGQLDQIPFIGYSLVKKSSTEYENFHTFIGDLEACKTAVTNNITDPDEKAVDLKNLGRLRLHHPSFIRIYDYFTFFDQSHNNNIIAGQININTAPWFVLKQLPWVGWENDPAKEETNALAMAITAFRDKKDLSNLGDPALDLPLEYDNPPDYSITRQAETGIAGIDEDLGFKSIGQLLQVINNAGPANSYDMRKYLDGSNLTAAPDYTPDSIDDDIKERNIIFHRISNLISVRSDVFTAYIQVKLGTTGPSKRVIAIFDRSKVTGPNDTPDLIALHPVPPVR